MRGTAQRQEMNDQRRLAFPGRNGDGTHDPILQIVRNGLPEKLIGGYVGKCHAAMCGGDENGWHVFQQHIGRQHASRCGHYRRRQTKGLERRDARFGLLHAQPRRYQAGTRKVRAKLVEPVDRRLIVGAVPRPALKDKCNQFAARHGNSRTDVSADTCRPQLYPYRIMLKLVGSQKIFDLHETRRLQAAHALNRIGEFPAVAGDEFIEQGADGFKGIAMPGRLVTQPAANRGAVAEQEDRAVSRTRKLAGRFERTRPQIRHERGLVDPVRKIIEHESAQPFQSQRLAGSDRQRAPTRQPIPAGSKCHAES
ncbi:hypothetical protein EOB77_05195 [Mesorhizobium sp. M7A.F.Ca.MR.228.00.0.0]|nr:hypothetical protein EOB77_05195 [Mesorhizobium sp. M7A.F.Ca.MR.228.00.0.0]